MEQEACQWRESLITIMRHFETLFPPQQRSQCPVQAFKPGKCSMDFAFSLLKYFLKTCWGCTAYTKPL